jgi:hypothetical protein
VEGIFCVRVKEEWRVFFFEINWISKIYYLIMKHCALCLYFTHKKRNTFSKEEMLLLCCLLKSLLEGKRYIQMEERFCVCEIERESERKTESVCDAVHKKNKSLLHFI